MRMYVMKQDVDAWRFVMKQDVDARIFVTEINDLI